MLTKSQIFASLITICGGLVLIGWQFSIPLLRGELGDFFVVPNAAVLFILCGIALLTSGSRSPFGHYANFSCAVFVLIFSAVTIAEHLSHRSFGIDNVIFAHRLVDWNNPALPPGRLSKNTAVAFLCAALSLLMVRIKWRTPPSQLLALVVMVISYLSILGHLYGIRAFYGRWMALSTALLFLLLSVGLFLNQEHLGITKLVLDRGPGGILARRLLATTLFVLPILGEIRINAERNGLVTLEEGTAFLVLVTVLLFVALILNTAAVLYRLDARRARAEHALRENEKLSAAGRFAATIAHEINNPLEAVTNIVYVVSNQAGINENSRTLLTVADEELKRIAHISRQTLGFYKESSSPEIFSPSSLVEEVVFLLKNRVQSKQLDIDRQALAPVEVYAVKGEVRQIISNLLSNAIDASPVGGVIIVSSALGENEVVEISVKDFGPGIPAALLSRIFQPFFSTKTDVGTGLGLWVTNNLVRKNKGTIQVRSSTKRGESGTIFTFSIPAAVVRPQVAQA
ncbi:MAG TPA: HAMP domain-containing sensor histidine kinase [Terriglobales bacterium]